MLALVVNEKLRAGWLEFLSNVKFDDSRKFDAEAEERKSTNAAATITARALAIRCEEERQLVLHRRHLRLDFARATAAAYACPGEDTIAFGRRLPYEQERAKPLLHALQQIAALPLEVLALEPEWSANKSWSATAQDAVQDAFIELSLGRDGVSARLDGALVRSVAHGVGVKGGQVRAGGAHGADALRATARGVGARAPELTPPDGRGEQQHRRGQPAQQQRQLLRQRLILDGCCCLRRLEGPFDFEKVVPPLTLRVFPKN